MVLVWMVAAVVVGLVLTFCLEWRNNATQDKLKQTQLQCPKSQKFIYVQIGIKLTEVLKSKPKTAKQRKPLFFEKW